MERFKRLEVIFSDREEWPQAVRVFLSDARHDPDRLVGISLGNDEHEEGLVSKWRMKDRVRSLSNQMKKASRGEKVLLLTEK